MEFKSFLFLEQKVYLSERIGDVLTGLQKLNNDIENMGKRHIMRIIDKIVARIRKILHGNWSYEEDRYLKELQKIGVSLMKGLDNKQDLVQLVTNCTDATEKLLDKLEKPINNVAAPAHFELNTDEQDDDEEDDD
jgi:hypothetical protein